MNVFTRLALALVERHQARGGGERFGVSCSYEPSCSEFAREALERHGLRRGVALAAGRLRRCRAPDRVGRTADPVPER